MTTGKLGKMLEIWEGCAKRLREQMRELSRVVGSIDGPLSNAIWAMDAEYTAAVSRLVGDKHGWLDWWANENDFGGKFANGAEVKGKEMPSSTLDDLVAIIEASK